MHFDLMFCSSFKTHRFIICLCLFSFHKFTLLRNNVNCKCQFASRHALLYFVVPKSAQNSSSEFPLKDTVDFCAVVLILQLSHKVSSAKYSCNWNVHLQVLFSEGMGSLYMPKQRHAQSDNEHIINLGSLEITLIAGNYLKTF